MEGGRRPEEALLVFVHYHYGLSTMGCGWGRCAPQQTFERTGSRQKPREILEARLTGQSSGSAPLATFATAFGPTWQVGTLFRISARKDLNWPEKIR